MEMYRKMGECSTKITDEFGTLPENLGSWTRVPDQNWTYFQAKRIERIVHDNRTDALENIRKEDIIIENIEPYMKKVIGKFEYGRKFESLKNIWENGGHLLIATDGGLKYNIGSFAYIFVIDKEE